MGNKPVGQSTKPNLFKRIRNRIKPKSKEGRSVESSDVELQIRQSNDLQESKPINERLVAEVQTTLNTTANSSDSPYQQGIKSGVQDKAARQEVIDNMFEIILKKQEPDERIQVKLDHLIIDVYLNLIDKDDEDLHSEAIANLQQIISNKHISFDIISYLYQSLTQETSYKKHKKEIDPIFGLRFSLQAHSLLNNNFNLKKNDEYLIKLKKSVEQSSFDKSPAERSQTINQIRKDFFNTQTSQDELDNQLITTLQTIIASRVPLNNKELASKISTNMKQYSEQLSKSFIYNSFVTPQEVADIINKRRENFLYPALEILKINRKDENIKQDIDNITNISINLKEINELFIKDYQQKSEEIRSLEQEVTTSINACYIEFEKAFNEEYEIKSIDRDIEALSKSTSSIIKRICHELQTLFLKIKNFFWASINLEKLEKDITILKQANDKYSELIRDLENKYNAYYESSNTNYLALTIGTDNQQDYSLLATEIESEKRHVLFNNPKTQQLISAIKLNENNQDDFNQTIKNIFNAIKNYQQQHAKGIDNKKTSIIFLYAFNKALEFIAVQQENNMSINLSDELTHRFMQVCNALNDSDIKLDEFGFKDEIEVHHLTSKLRTFNTNIEITDPEDEIINARLLEELKQCKEMRHIPLPRDENDPEIRKLEAVMEDVEAFFKLIENSPLTKIKDIISREPPLTKENLRAIADKCKISGYEDLGNSLLNIIKKAQRNIYSEEHFNSYFTEVVNKILKCIEISSVRSNKNLNKDSYYMKIYDIFKDQIEKN